MSTSSMTTSPPASPAHWLEGYAPPRGSYDEFQTPEGAIRPAWQKLAALLRGLPPGEMARRGEHLRRLIQENGITYNVYDESGDSARPWGMDLLPMILEWAEWQKVGAALRQRVHLLNLVLQDFYGPQTLLGHGVVPAELVLGNPAFLRPCHGLAPADGVWAHVYGADLARAPDGQWWALSDRLDAPSGIGYALENRFLTTRVLSDWLREHRAARLDGFFERMRAAFERLAASRADHPRLVLLTPGPANETYFEHSFLARNQGLALVEGGDLVVRHQRVYLKTLAGLQPVDVILRRVDAEFCDPLELRSDSLLGVPGLLQAARAGQVTLANRLGAGLLESAGLSPFLPALCRRLLGEELQMPSVATWWCGQPRELDYVLEHLDELILQPAFRPATRPAAVGARLSAAERDHWRARLRAEPAAWCARERMAPATTPMLAAGQLAPRLFHLRAFLVADGGEYHAMTGGLTRIPADPEDFSVSMQHGSLGKDTWVLPPPERAATAAEISAPAAAPVKLRRQTADLPSRVADNLYWLGRYLERAEGQARVLRLLADALTEQGAAAEPTAVEPFLALLEMAAPRWPGNSATPALDYAAVEAALRAQCWDAAAPRSLAANLLRLGHAAYRVKERLSADTWRLLGRLRRAPAAASVHDAIGELTEIITLLAAVSGLLIENMTRGYGWRFVDLGRRLERGLFVAGLLRRALVPPNPPPALLHHALVCCDSLLTYRRRYLTNLQALPVLDLLARDEANPRSLAFQLQAVREHVEALPRVGGDEAPGAPERLALALFSHVRLADVRALAAEDGYGARPALADFLAPVVRDLAALSDALGQVYFAHGVSGTEDIQ